MRHIIDAIPDPDVRRSLRVSRADVVLWGAMFGLAEHYIAPFALLFGAGGLAVAVLQGSGQLMVAVGQLIGVGIADRLRLRKPWVVTSVLLHGASWIALIVAARTTGSVGPIIVLFASGILITSMGGPSWVSWMNQIVPASIRGRYWGGRNRLAGLTQFVTMLFAGYVLSRSSDPRVVLNVFTVLFVVAGIARMAGAIPLALQAERGRFEGPGRNGRAGAPRTRPPSPNDIMRGPFGRFVFFAGLMMFAAGLMGPALPLFLLNSHGLSYLSYSVVTMTAMVLSFTTMRYWGPLADRFGNYRILFATASLLPFLGFAWAFARSIPIVMVIQIVGGFAWSGFNLSATNYIFDSQPVERAGRAVGYYAAITNVCAFLGSIVAGVVIERIAHLSIPLLMAGNLEIVFVASGAFRLLVVALLLRSFAEVRDVEGTPPRRYFYFFQPLAAVGLRLEFFRTWVLRRPPPRDGGSGTR